MTDGSDNVADPVLLMTKFEEEISSLQLLCEQFQVYMASFPQNPVLDKNKHPRKSTQQGQKGVRQHTAEAPREELRCSGENQGFW